MESSSLKTLLIQHNPADARLIQAALTEAKGASFDLEWVDNLSSGLKRLSSGEIDIVLLDLTLSSGPGLSGEGTAG
jgi:DNA-binding response OmpR family regulator